MKPAIDSVQPSLRGLRSDVRRLIVVSHRLPVVIDRTSSPPALRRSVGGLATGIEAFLRSPAAAIGSGSSWIGWPGDLHDPSEGAALAAEGEAMGIVPVFLDRKMHDPYYAGFCNRALWPLMHTMPMQAHLDAGEFEAYCRANEAFCDAVLAVARPGDAVWIHDFHLMMLPAMLRSRDPNLPTVYFHHVPFPAFDVLRVLPDAWARSLVGGALGADVVGFHTYDDVRGFVRAADRLLGFDASGGVATTDGRAVRVDAFPIGVDFDAWNRAADDPEVQRELTTIEAPLGGRKIVISVDRLDYTKGILNRLLAFERLLERRPDWRDRVTLVVVAAPSRVDVEAYRRMRVLIDEAVGRINGTYGSPSWAPVLYQYRGLGRAAVAALYLRADVALVTPLRDGMNLVAKEFLASRRDEGGVLVLSDTAGAARELGEAVLVNPFHIEGLADAIELALEMPPEDRARRTRHMRARLARYDVARWGAEQLASLKDARRRTAALRERRLAPAHRARLVTAWREAERRLLLLDYDGTLVGFTEDPAAATPDEGLRDLLGRLGRDPRNQVIIVSGRDVETLDRWFSGLPVSLAGEHGARSREPDGCWTSGPGISPEVRRRVIEVMEVFADRLPGAFVEEKSHSIAWHWRAADSDVGTARAAELALALSIERLGPELQVLSGRKVIEARVASAHKGTVARRWATQGPWGVIVAAGDDATDEDLFCALPEEAWSLRIGPGESRARFNLEGPEKLRRLLEELSRAENP